MLLVVSPSVALSQNAVQNPSWFVLNVYLGVNQEQGCYSSPQVATGPTGLVVTAAARQATCSGKTESLHIRRCRLAAAPRVALRHHRVVRG